MWNKDFISGIIVGLSLFWLIALGIYLLIPESYIDSWFLP